MRSVEKLKIMSMSRCFVFKSFILRLIKIIFGATDVYKNMEDRSF